MTLQIYKFVAKFGILSAIFVAKFGILDAIFVAKFEILDVNFVAKFGILEVVFVAKFGILDVNFVAKFGILWIFSLKGASISGLLLLWLRPLDPYIDRLQHLAPRLLREHGLCLCRERHYPWQHRRPQDS